MEVVGFEVGGTRYGVEPHHARIFSQKLREFARGEYAGDLAEIKRRTRLDAAEWLDGAVPLADRVDRWAAEDRDDAIALADDVQARAAYAVLSITYSDGWDAREVSELWDALGMFLGLGGPTADELPPPIMGSGYHRLWVVATSTACPPECAKCCTGRSRPTLLRPGFAARARRPGCARRSSPNALSDLNPRMRRVLALRFGLDGETPQTLEEVGVGWESRASACANSSPAPYASCAQRHRPRAISARRISGLPKARLKDGAERAAFGSAERSAEQTLQDSCQTEIAKTRSVFRAMRRQPFAFRAGGRVCGATRARSGGRAPV